MWFPFYVYPFHRSPDWDSGCCRSRRLNLIMLFGLQIAFMYQLAAYDYRLGFYRWRGLLLVTLFCRQIERKMLGCATIFELRYWYFQLPNPLFIGCACNQKQSILQLWEELLRGTTITCMYSQKTLNIGSCLILLSYSQCRLIIFSFFQ